MQRVLSWVGAVPFKTIFFAGLPLALALTLALQWEAITTLDWRLAWRPFILALLLFALGPLVAAISFWLVVVRLTGSTPLSEALVVWARSFAVRYVPSGALTVAVRIHERGRLRATRAQVWSATVYEQLVSALAGAAFAITALVAAGEGAPVAAVAILTGAITVATTARVVHGRWAHRLPLARHVDRSLLLGVRHLGPAVAVSGIGWVLTGVAASIFVRSISPLHTAGFLFLAGAYSLAWLVGFVVPFVPSGLGVREVTLAALLAPRFGAAGATTLVLGLRLANVAGDLAGLATIEAVYRITRSFPRPRPTAAVRAS